MVIRNMIPIREMAEHAVKASRILATAPSDLKNRALRGAADQLASHTQQILAANADDVDAVKRGRQSSALIDRLTLTPSRIEAMATGLRTVADLPDPVGEVTDEWSRPNGLIVRKVRIPLGVIGMIYESRPNVTADAAALCLKSSNAVILRGGREALHSNEAIAAILQNSFASASIPEYAVQLISDPNYSILDEMLKLDGLIDLIIPRGGEALIERVSEKSRIPVLKHAKGVCHVYVDHDADLAKALEIAFNAKVQRPGVCNAMETLLVHKNAAQQFIPQIINKYQQADVIVKGCQETRHIAPGIEPATEEDWSTEYLDLIVSIRVVEDTIQAIEHIERYGSKHTEAIVTENTKTASEFVQRVQSSAVLVNASTRFNDGAELGLGAEIGISTSKLHAFGPMGLRELTTTKFVVWGDGQIRV